MKVYATGSSDEISRLEMICRQNGWQFKSMSRIGRPRVNYYVENVLDAYKTAGTIRGAARLLSMPPGTVQGILRREGILKKAK